MRLFDLAQNRAPLRIISLYLLLGALWIVFSDQLVELLFRDPAQHAVVNTLKGWAFIGVTACLLYVLLWREQLQRQQAQTRIINLNRLYATLSQINQAVVRVRDRDTLFKEVCRVAVEYGQFRLAWIGLIDETDRRLKPVTAAGEAQAYLEGMEISDQDEALGRGLTGTIMREDRPMMSRDITIESAMPPGRERALAFGLHSLASVPLRQGGRIIGALLVYADAPNVFTSAEEQLLNEIGLDVSFALDMLDQAQQRDQAEEALRRSAARLADLHELDHAVLAADSPIELAQAALVRLRKLVPCQRASLLLFDETATHARLFVSDFTGDSAGPRDALLDLGSFGVSEDLRQGRAQQVDDIHRLDQSAAVIETLGLQGVQAFIHAPLRADGALLGALYVGAAAPGAFGGDHLEIVSEVADVLALALRQTQLRDQIAQHAADLEQRVAERTAALDGANVQLRARNEELKAFAYTVSHDLKAPLRGISGYAQELDRRHRAGLNDRAQFCLAQIITATRNLDQLIEDLLHYSRLDAETPTLGEINVRDLIDRWRLDRQQQIDELGAQITIDLSVERVRGWERGLTQALTNLLDNALKYSREAQPPQVTVRLEEDAAAYRLRVHDNGIGFDMKYHDRIFGLFNRLVRAAEFEGTGAGLAIAKKAIEKQGGRLWADAQLGAGATFTIEIPKSGEQT